ncbi:hypothetical protein [Rhizobium mongolense]|uniref:Uncharacterized protein n=2 Tax=Rhizobium mongolense TaxID=57676 RepID=A0ABR6IFD0_9HYPH|nr:hypothetical protein [Rhizobium mongolense]MBB4226353.1 hypothetical protein [Rhizobium mongolense]TVZ73632.1 hypothetical protein BCL32_1880 [Rhizobium mongolense USDA 1844]
MRISNIIRPVGGTIPAVFRFGRMKSEPDEPAVLQYLPYETDKALVRQLQSLPTFAVPSDTDEAFGRFLKRLDAIRERRGEVTSTE